jgi:curved DNA-binding protein CbpA
MSSSTNYYQTLGVLPDAESVVITAAYRALASLYHPDRWKGDKEFATKKMADINVAYATLSDPDKRQKYNNSRQNTHNSFAEEDEQTDQAFDTALSEMEKRWKVATEIFPDLISIRLRLSKTSHRLSFAFVIFILESKKFDDRNAIANSLEKNFLELHFGTDSKIILFAKFLISQGNKKAVVALNNYVDVLGSSINPQLIIEKITKEFNLKFYKFLQVDGEPLRALQRELVRGKYLGDALDLIHASGLFIEEKGSSIFASKTRYEILMDDPTTGRKHTILSNQTVEEVIDWTTKNLC